MTSTAIVHAPPSDEHHRLDLFAQLTPSQQRVLLLSNPDDNRAVAAARIGLSEAAVAGWLAEVHPTFNPAFRALWYNRGRGDPVAYMEALVTLHGPSNLQNVAGIAALARDPKAWLALKERTQGHVLRAAERLALLPLERHDRRQAAQQVDAITEVVSRLVGRSRDVQAYAEVVDVELLPQETEASDATDSD